jgi:glutaminase
MLFGNTESIALDMLSALNKVDYLVVDLKRVITADQASILLLSDLRRRKGVQAKHLSSPSQHLYRFKRHLKALARSPQDPAWLQFDDIDHAVEWCEDRSVAEAELASSTHLNMTDLCHQYLCSDMIPEEIGELSEVVMEKQFPAGSRIVRQGDHADSLYFILDDQVDVLVVDWTKCSSTVDSQRCIGTCRKIGLIWAKGC